MLAVAVIGADGTEDYLGVIKTSENGYFSMEYIPVTISGAYNASVKSLQEEFTSTVNIRLNSDITKLLGIINSETLTTETALEALKTYAELLSIDLDLYTNLTDKSFIGEGLINSVKENGTYKSIEKLISDIKALAVICTVKASDDMYTVFSEYESLVLSSDDDVYAEWADLSDSEKTDVLEAVIDADSYVPDTFAKNIYVQSLFTMIANTNKYINVKNAIESYPDLLGIELDEYNDEGKPTSVAKGLCGKKWNTDTFADKFNALVKEAGKSSTMCGSGSTGGGSSFGGSSMSANIPMPQATAEPINTPNPTAEAKQFNDMGEAEWAKEAVYSLCERGIIDGYEDGSFKPNEKITREEFVTIIVRYLGLNTGAECEFEDVSDSDWFYSYIAEAVTAGIVNGISGSEFGTANIMKRQDAAVVLYNIGGISGSNAELSFSDKDKIAAYAEEAIKALSEKGIIDGNPDGSFEPEGGLTRAQTAKLIYVFDSEKEKDI